MKKYRILFEQTVRSELVVTAKSYEDAVKKAQEQVRPEIAQELMPVWVGTEQIVKKTEEYEYEVVGVCEKCGNPIVSRPIGNSEYTYGSDDDGHLVCFDCFVKGPRKKGQ